MHFDPVNSTTLAKKRWNGIQIAFFFLGLLAFVGVFRSLSENNAILFFGIILLAAYGSYMGLRIISVFTGLFLPSTLKISQEKLSRLSNEDLPVYTALLPVYREVDVLPRLVQAMTELDYPKEKLDVKILLEWDDQETRAQIQKIVLPTWIEVVEVPQGFPKTKPRACNYGLARARGEFTVIFDAEDRPDKDQLKKSVAAFRDLDSKTVCLQAQLNCYNPNENLFTRLFTLEYTAWFDLYLPGLYSIGSPIPLGGTSNHFRTEALKKLGGWDAYNVTEDCDLGIRIARRKLETRVLQSTTWEEAPSRLKDWIKQRTRWLKGYFQTLLVHTQNPWTALREFGVLKYFYFCTVVGGQVGTLMLAPVAWFVAIAWIWFRWPIMDPVRPWTSVLFSATVVLSLFSIVFVGIHWVASHLRGRRKLGPWSLLFPFYWLLMSVATWRGVFQFFSDPFKWEKTPHGISGLNTNTYETQSLKTPKAVWHAVFLAVFIGFVFLISLPVSKFIARMAQRYCFSNVVYEEQSTYCRIPIAASWVDKQKLKLVIRLPDKKYYERDKFRLRFSLEVNNGEVFERSIQVPAAKDNEVVVDFKLDEGWTSSESDFTFSAKELMRVKFLTVEIDQSLPKTSRFDVRSIEAEGVPLPRSNRLVLEKTVASVQQNGLFQVGFHLDNFYENPFDPEEIDLWLNVETPQGKVERVPAFWNQLFRKGAPVLVKGILKEKLVATVPAFWSARYTPSLAGEYRWWIEGKDSQGFRFLSPKHSLRTVKSTLSGPVASKGKYFVKTHIQEDGKLNESFYYPVGINLAWPRDNRNVENWDFPLPPTESGAEVLVKYIDKLSRSGVNLVRVWMAPWWGGLEWNASWPEYNGIGFYSLKNAWRIDQVFTAAEEKEVLVNLMLDPHGPYTQVWDTQWDENPYNILNGGFLLRGRHILSNGEAKRLFKNRYRYLAARYGNRPGLFAWTLFNEGNTLTSDVELYSKWNAEMIDTLNNHTARKPMASTSQILASGITLSPNIWKIPQIGFSQISGYDFGKGMTETIAEKAALVSEVSKPAMVDEYGGGPFGGTMDFISRQIHDGLWASWMGPWASTPLAWWWSFVVERGVLKYYEQFDEFIRGENLLHDEWKFEKTNLTPHLDALLRVGHQSAFAWVYQPAEKPQIVQDAQLKFSGLQSGKYRVEFWDTWGKGRTQVKTVLVNTDSITISLPSIEKDLAVKIKREK